MYNQYMKKTILPVMTLLILLLTIAACTSIQAHPGNPLASNLVRINNVQYVRVTWHSSGERYPVVTVISSRNELQRYYRHKNVQLLAAAQFHSYSTAELANAVANYTDDFFANNFLVMILLEENSGSITHNVEKIDNNGNIFISRFIPEMGTADMAKWYILIELENKFKRETFNVIFM